MNNSAKLKIIMHSVQAQEWSFWKLEMGSLLIEIIHFATRTVSLYVFFDILLVLPNIWLA